MLRLALLQGGKVVALGKVRMKAVGSGVRGVARPGYVVAGKQLGRNGWGFHKRRFAKVVAVTLLAGCMLRIMQAHR